MNYNTERILLNRGNYKKIINNFNSVVKYKSDKRVSISKKGNTNSFFILELIVGRGILYISSLIEVRCEGFVKEYNK